MYQDNKIWIGMAGDEKVYIYPGMANRHGMIAGATGTGKTITLKVLAESFSDCGVPVFLADVKGDLAAMCKPGVISESLQNRIDDMGLAREGFAFDAYPTTYWDIYGEKGLPLRTTISEMGPLLLSRILELNDTQSDILTVIFKIADDEGLLLIDTKDLRAMIQYVGENAKELTLRYGNITKPSLGAITRAIIALESEGGELFFSEPALNISDWFCRNREGNSFTTCSILVSRDLEALLKSKCASSKKNTILGASRSPTSGRVSNSSDSIHSRKVAYIVGLLTSVWQSRTWITPLPSRLRQNQSEIFRAGSLKNNSPPGIFPTAFWRSWATRYSTRCTRTPLRSKRAPKLPHSLSG